MVRVRRGGHRKPTSGPKRALEEKKVSNSRYKHRGSATVELLRKQLQLEKSRSAEESSSKIQELCPEAMPSVPAEPSQATVFQDLIDDLKTTGKTLLNNARCKRQ